MTNKNDNQYTQSEQDFSEIRIKELLQRANINRSTFYAHYDDKYALLSALEDDLLIAGMRTLTMQAPDNALQSFQHLPLIFHKYLVRITAYIAQHRSEFELLLNLKTAAISCGCLEAQSFR